MEKSFSACLLLCLALALAGAGATLPARALTWTANPVADAFVTTGPSNNLTANNYGGAGALAVSGSSESKGTFDSVIRFDLAGAKASFDAAFGAGSWAAQSLTLRLTSTSANNAIFNANAAGPFTIVWMQDDSWVEGAGTPMAPAASGLTYASLPGFLGAGDQGLGTFSYAGGDALVSTYTLGSSPGWQGDLAAGSLASFELRAANPSMSYLFNSRSFGTVANRPLLTITAVAVPEPAAYLLLGMAAPFLPFACRARAAHARR